MDECLTGLTESDLEATLPVAAQVAAVCALKCVYVQVCVFKSASTRLS